jgi:hypothetical protein
MRRILTRILLLAVPVTLGCSSDSSQTSDQPFPLLLNNQGNCTSHLQFNVAVESEKATPPAQLRIESCRLDVDACTDFCTFELNAISKLPEYAAMFVTSPVFNGQPAPQPGIGGFPPSGVTTPGFTPTKCSVSFDGGTANAEIAIDLPSVGPGCFNEVGAGATGVGSGTGSGGGL